MIHPDDTVLFDNLSRLAFDISDKFNLGLKEFVTKQRPYPTGSYGLCYYEDMKCCIALRWKEPNKLGGKWHDERIPLSVTLNTLAHELAHFKEHTHNKKHERLTCEILDYVNSNFYA